MSIAKSRRRGFPAPALFYDEDRQTIGAGVYSHGLCLPSWTRRHSHLSHILQLLPLCRLSSDPLYSPVRRTQLQCLTSSPHHTARLCHNLLPPPYHLLSSRSNGPLLRKRLQYLSTLTHHIDRVPCSLSPLLCRLPLVRANDNLRRKLRQCLPSWIHFLVQPDLQILCRPYCERTLLLCHPPSDRWSGYHPQRWLQYPTS